MNSRPSLDQFNYYFNVGDIIVYLAKDPLWSRPAGNVQTARDKFFNMVKYTILNRPCLLEKYKQLTGERELTKKTFSNALYCGFGPDLIRLIVE